MMMMGMKELHTEMVCPLVGSVGGGSASPHTQLFFFFIIIIITTIIINTTITTDSRFWIISALCHSGKLFNIVDIILIIVIIAVFVDNYYSLKNLN